MLTKQRPESSFRPTSRIEEGIPCYLRYPPPAPGPREARLGELNRLAREKDWRSALLETYSGDEELIHYVTDRSRAAYLDLLPIRPDSAILEIGASLGQHTVEIASRAGSVHALEVIPGQAQFTDTRCRQSGLRNVQVACGGDDGSLPCHDGSFDGVVANLVFEWCATRALEERPAEVQRRFIAETARVLRPGGFLYLATKNRFALRHLLGMRDENAQGTRFGNALPRWALAMVLRLSGKGPHRSLLHSYSALRRMILDGGYREVESYWAIPDMRFPRRYVPTDARAIRRERKAEGRGASKSDAVTRLVPAPMVKHVAPGLVFLARKA
jgi:SAM-dependent methyltransferase